MHSKRARLDRFLSSHLGIKRGAVRAVIARGRVCVDGRVATRSDQLVDQFTRVALDGQVLQARKALYLMLNKPAGVVSATVDARHTTVVDLLDHPGRDDLHIVGRLDFNSSGLVLLTNDGRWSRQLTAPEHRVPKRYRVTVEQPVTEEQVRAFAEGMYFAYENLWIRPAQLIILSEHVAEVILTEGRYHQIKRMFGRFRNRVVDLHRIAIGNLILDPALAMGQSRELTGNEIEGIARTEQPGAVDVSIKDFDK